MTADALTIGDLAKATDTKVETVRYYERIGLMPEPRRTPSNYRNYDARHAERLGFIRRSRALGFSLEQVRELLGLQMTATAPVRPSMKLPVRTWPKSTGKLQI